MTKLDPDTLHWAAERVAERKRLCEKLGYVSAALAGMEECYIILEAAAHRVLMGKDPSPTSKLEP
jgi:hypothetical protein